MNRKTSVRKITIILMAIVSMFGGGVSFAENGDTALETQCRECAYIVVGRIVEVKSTEHPGGKTVSTANLRVERCLKGDLGSKVLDVEIRFDSCMDLKPDDGDVIWFIRGKLDDGRYLITDWRWGTHSLRSILKALARIDKKTRIPGMPEPPKTEDPISLALAIDDGDGKALTTISTASLEEVSFLAQFENRGKSPLAVMPCLDGSDIHWRYPYYDLEVIDSTGKPVDVRWDLRCGNINRFTKRDIVSLQPREVFRTWTWTIFRPINPGKYRIRLKYTAKQDLKKSGLPLGEDDPEVKELIKTVWEGTIQSNWIEVEVLPETQGAEK